VSFNQRFNFWKLACRSMWFYRRVNFQVLCGTIFASAVLVGALAVGDSVKHTLANNAANRIGRIDYAWTAGERFFRQALASEAEQALKPSPPTPSPSSVQSAAGARDLHIEPVLIVPGTAISQGGAARANQVQVLGVSPALLKLARQPSGPLALAPEQAAVNRRLSDQLGLKVGDELLLRVRQPSAMPSDAPLSTVDKSTTTLRVRVSRMLSPAELGDFALQASPVAPYNIFVSLPWLADQLKITNRANCLLVSASGAADPNTLADALRRCWQLADAGLELHALTNSAGWELRSERVFLDPAIESVLTKHRTSQRGTNSETEVFSYFVNEIMGSTNRTPYSLVSALEPLPRGLNLADDEIAITDWLARDLEAGPGSLLTLKYYVLGPLRKLVETNSVFRVQSIIPMDNPAVTPDLMPAFPGLAEAGSCRDWDPGIPIDLNRIRKQDEAYWDRYRGTPKAFVTLPAARRMWANRYGSLTAIRFPDTNATSRPAISKANGTAPNSSPMARSWEPMIRALITPELMGMQLLPIRASGLQSSQATVDFGQLFLGLSFFLIASALMLTALLFVFSLEQRTEEMGTLKSLGYRSTHIGLMLMREAALVVGFGVVGGLVVGIGYAQLLLEGLSSIWQGAVGGTGVDFYLSPTTALMGVITTVILVLAVLAAVMRQKLRRTVVELHQSILNAPRKSRATRRLLAALVCLAIAAIALFWGRPDRGVDAAGIFFGAGAALLLGMLLLVDCSWFYLEQSRPRVLVRWSRVALQNCTRRRGRSLAAASILACGTFLVISVAANRHDPTREADRRDRGTGGFALYGESTLPILLDLNSPEGRKQYALDEPKFNGISYVSLRVRAGDDASCLNLNRAQQPRVLGVDPQELNRRKSFSFQRLDARIDPAAPWLGLDLALGTNEIPAVVDDTVLTWGLGKKLGDAISYQDDQGRELNLRVVGTLANSILQGSMIISQAAFVARFPSISGARVFLVDMPVSSNDDLSRNLTSALQDWGVEFTPAARRLADFNQVELTYLSIFGMLGGLGILLGAAGMGIMVMRNVLERRGELAILRAVGFSRGSLRQLLVYEHGYILIAGTVCGAVAALLAVAPAIRTAGSDMPWLWLGIVIAGSLINGLFWTILASALSTQGDLLPALREE
jgi:putative ABC transport system permease protein